MNVKETASETVNFFSEVSVGHPIARSRVFECFKRPSEESEYEP